MAAAREEKDLPLSKEDVELFESLLTQEFDRLPYKDSIIDLAKDRNWKNGKGFKEVFFDYIKTKKDEEIIPILKNIINQTRAVGRVFWVPRGWDYVTLGSGLMAEINTEYNRRIADPSSIRAKVYYSGRYNNGLDLALEEALSKLPEDKETRQKVLDATDTRGNSAVYFATTYANHWALEKLIAAGADVNIGSLYTPLQCAIVLEDKFSVRKLLIAGADANRETVNYNRWTHESQCLMSPAEVALTNYTEHGKKDEIFYMLWDKGAKIDKALSAAVEYGRIDFLRNFIEASGLELYNMQYAGETERFKGKTLFEISRDQVRELFREQAIVPVIKSLCDNELKFEEAVFRNYAQSSGYAGNKSFKEKVLEYICLQDIRDAQKFLNNCLDQRTQLGKVFMTYSSDSRWLVFKSERDVWVERIQSEIRKRDLANQNDLLSAQINDAQL